MSNDLNLLPNVAKFQAQRLRLKSQILLGVEIFAGVWILAVVSIFALGFVFKLRYNALDKRYRGIVLDMENFAKDIVLTQQTKYKLKVVGNILNSRFEYGKAFDAIANLFGEGVEVTNYDLSENGNISIQAKALGYAAMDEVEEKIVEITQGEDETFESAKINSLAYDSGSWSFSLEVVLK